MSTPSGVIDQFFSKKSLNDELKREGRLMGDNGSPVVRKSADFQKVYRQRKTIGTVRADKNRANVRKSFGAIHPIVILAPS